MASVSRVGSQSGSTVRRATGLIPIRERQWMYLGPIFAAPLAHIGVSLYRSAKTKTQKQVIVGVGILGSTALTLGMRMYLMYHAGFPCKEMDETTGKERILFVAPDKKAEIENPSTKKILGEAFRGFG